METNSNQESQISVLTGSVDYASAPRKFNRFGRGRSMKKFCKLAREGQIEMKAKLVSPLFVYALEEDNDEAEWSINKMGLTFAQGHSIKEQKLANDGRFVGRLEPAALPT